MLNKFLGKDFVLFMERDSEMFPVCCGRDLSISISSEMIELTKAPSSDWKNYLYGDKTFSVSTSNLFVIGNSFTLADFLNAIINRISLVFVTRVGDNDDLLLTGKINITNIDIVGNNKDVIQYSIQATGTGALTNEGTEYTITLTDGEGNILTDGEGNTLTETYYAGELPMNISIDC